MHLPKKSKDGSHSDMDASIEEAYIHLSDKKCMKVCVIICLTLCIENSMRYETTNNTV